MQICTNISESDYAEIVHQAEAEGSSRGKKAADLIRFALAGGQADEVARLELELEHEVTRLELEVAHTKEMLAQLKEENGFLRASFATLETDIARPLTRLLSEGPKHWSFLSWFRRKPKEEQQQQ